MNFKAADRPHLIRRLWRRLGAQQGFTFTATITKKGRRTVKVTGKAPSMFATVKLPIGYGTGASAAVQFAAEVNPARTSSLKVSLTG